MSHLRSFPSPVPLYRPSWPTLSPPSPGLLYRRASSTFLCFGRQAEVVVTVCFVESVPEVSCSHDNSRGAAVSPTRRVAHTSKMERTLLLLYVRRERRASEKNYASAKCANNNDIGTHRNCRDRKDHWRTEAKYESYVFRQPWAN